MNQTATYQRNLESSILFIQQEHANTLKALHEEIHSLQKKCSGTFLFNFVVVVFPPTIGQDQAVSELCFDTRLR